MKKFLNVFDKIVDKVFYYIALGSLYVFVGGTILFVGGIFVIATINEFLEVFSKSPLLAISLAFIIPYIIYRLIKSFNEESKRREEEFENFKLAKELKIKKENEILLNKIRISFNLEQVIENKFLREIAKNKIFQLNNLESLETRVNDGKLEYRYNEFEEWNDINNLIED